MIIRVDLIYFINLYVIIIVPHPKCSNLDNVQDDVVLSCHSVELKLRSITRWEVLFYNIYASDKNLFQYIFILKYKSLEITVVSFSLR